MPQTKEERAIYQKKWKELNKEKLKQQQQQRYLLNKEKLLQQNKEWRELNKDYNKQYNQTPTGKKSIKIASWKRQGMILREGQTWDSIYRTYVDCINCEQCDKVFQTTRDIQLDHCHTTGFIRNIVCCRCNHLRALEDAKKLIWVIEQD